MATEITSNTPVKGLPELVSLGSIHVHNKQRVSLESFTVFKQNDTVLLWHFNRIHVLQNNQTSVIFVCPSAVQSSCITTDQKDAKVTLWVLLESHKLYCLNIGQILKTPAADGSCDIFDDLLNDTGSNDSTLPGVKDLDSDSLWCQLADSTCAVTVTNQHVIALERTDAGSCCRYLPCNKCQGNLQHTVCTKLIPGSLVGACDLSEDTMALCVVRPWDKDETGRPGSLDQKLYTSLFGTELGLLDSEVLLVGTHSGTIWGCNIKDPGPVQIADIGQQVIRISSCKLSEDSHQNDGILVVGKQGRVMLIRYANQLLYQTWQTPGQVLGAAVAGIYLVQSTEDDMVATDLQQLASCLNPKPDVKFTNIPLQNVTALAAYADRKGLSVTKGAQIAAVTIHVNAAMLFNVKIDMTHFPDSKPTQCDMKDVLTSITMVSQKLQDIQLQLTGQDVTLSQIGLAAVVAGKQLVKTDGKWQRPVECRARVRTLDDGLHLRHQAVVTVTNNLDVPFQSGWQLEVSMPQVHPGARSPFTQEVHQLGVLNPGCSRTITLDLTVHPDCPRICLVCYLTYTSKCLIVDIGSQMLDIMHFCRPSSLKRNMECETISQLISSTKGGKPSTPQQTTLYNAAEMLSAETACKLCETTQKDNLEEAILNTLLGDCQITEGSSSILLAVPGNNTLMISIKMEPQGQYSIKLQSSSLAVVQEAHQAIKSRLCCIKPWTSEISPSVISKQVKQIEDLQRQCCQLEELLTDGSTSVTVSNHLMELYSKLRCTNVIVY